MAPFRYRTWNLNRCTATSQHREELPPPPPRRLRRPTLPVIPESMPISLCPCPRPHPRPRRQVCRGVAARRTRFPIRCALSSLFPRYAGIEHSLRLTSKSFMKPRGSDRIVSAYKFMLQVHARVHITRPRFFFFLLPDATLLRLLYMCA